MLKLLTILFFALSPLTINACSYAYQYSLFPLGSSGADLLILEVELERYVNTPSMGMMAGRPNASPLSNTGIETRWKGHLRLKSTNATLALHLLEELAYVDISDERYNEALAPYFEKAMQRARALPFFEEAYLDKVAYCGYDRSCQLFELHIDSVPPALKCALPAGPQQLVQFPNIILQKYENVTQLNFSEIETVADSSRIEFYKVWKPCSARYYKIAEKELVIYSIGWGQKRGYVGKKEEDWKPNLMPVEKFIEGNDVMMHGQRFDFCQFL